MLQLKDRQRHGGCRVPGHWHAGPCACPGPHLLGLQEVGVPQLTDDHLTLLHCGGLAQVWRQVQDGGRPCPLPAMHAPQQRDPRIGSLCILVSETLQQPRDGLWEWSSHPHNLPGVAPMPAGVEEAHFLCQGVLEPARTQISLLPPC